VYIRRRVGDICLVSAAKGAPLGLNEGNPLVMGSFVDFSYNPTGAGANGLFTLQAVSGVSMMTYDLDGSGDNFVDPADFQLSVQINPLTAAAVSGSLNVTGDINLDGKPETLFYSHSLVSFGYGFGR